MTNNQRLNLYVIIEKILDYSKCEDGEYYTTEDFLLVYDEETRNELKDMLKELDDYLFDNMLREKIHKRENPVDAILQALN